MEDHLRRSLPCWHLVLGPYWLAPVPAGDAPYEAPTLVLARSRAIYVIGVVLMMGSDAQKYFVLKVKRGLITDGFFARMRHPNYLGEMMVYGSFAVLAGHWIPWAVLAVGVARRCSSDTPHRKRAWRATPSGRRTRRAPGFLLPALGGRDEAAPTPAPRPG